jgi:hypothetical protein
MTTYEKEQIRLLGGIQASISVILNVQIEMLAALKKEPVDGLLDKFIESLNSNTNLIQIAINQNLGITTNSNSKKGLSTTDLAGMFH